MPYSPRLTAFALISTVVLAACARPAADMPSMAGTCLEVHVALPSDAADLLEYQPPPLVVLDTTGAPPWPRRILPLPGSLPSVHYGAAWSQVPGDTLELGWSSGPSGLMLRLHARGDTLHGRAETISEVAMPLAGTAFAVPFPCDAPVPAHLARQHPPMPGLLLDGQAEPLAIGAEFPRQALQFEEPTYERMILHEQPTGIFAAADSVVVETDPAGVIVRLRLTFPTAAGAETAIRGIAGDHGQPVSLADGRQGWRDRERWITLAPRPDGRGAVLVIADPRFAR